MAKKIAAVPAGYKTVTPFLVVRGADQALAYYGQVFEASVGKVERSELTDAINNAELKIGTSMIRLCEEVAEYSILSPISFGGTAVGLFIYHKDVEAVLEAATTAGAEVIQAVTDNGTGEMTARFIDPFGHVWTVAQRVAIAKVIAEKDVEKLAAVA